MRQIIMQVGVSVNLIDKWHSIQMRMAMVFIRMRMNVDVLDYFMDMPVFVVFAQHQPGACNHDRYGKPEFVTVHLAMNG
jgi:hypothetical protein